MRPPGSRFHHPRVVHHQVINSNANPLHTLQRRVTNNSQNVLAPPQLFSQLQRSNNIQRRRGPRIDRLLRLYLPAHLPRVFLINIPHLTIKQ
ncbi:hypothetical protein CCHR01_07047 [Colletotrichum chrysophilum]|uniref:Uncharacterized protein n=1 Tax=Colletotrichum chrysophilum TaxID=1836956 RepID=A0AAD9EJ78_9PEZI|nr:hypothetical protein CCHR01_07047 [Colletotrichum chrysophilum]